MFNPTLLYRTFGQKKSYVSKNDAILLYFTTIPEQLVKEKENKDTFLLKGHTYWNQN